MSRRLLKKGRYPKDASIYQNPTQVMQDHQPVSSNPSYSQAAEVPLYSTQPIQQQQFQVSQSSETNWQQNSVGSVSSGQNNSQQQPYWSGDPSYAMARPPEDNAWNWTASSSHDHNNQLQQYQSSQQPQQYQPIPQQYQTVQQQDYPATQHHAPTQQLYQPAQQPQQYPSTQQQKQSMQQQEQYPSSKRLPQEQYPSIPQQQYQSSQSYQSSQQIYDQRQEIAYTTLPYPPEHQSSNQQEKMNAENNWYQDPTKLNGNQAHTEMAPPPWEIAVPNAVQPENLPWTYDVPQNAPLPNTEWSNSNFMPTTVNTESTSNWESGDLQGNYNNYALQQNIGKENSNPDNDSIVNHVSESIEIYQQQKNIVENIESCESASDSRNLQSSQIKDDPPSGSLNAFFHHSIEENIELSPAISHEESDNSLKNDETASSQCLSDNGQFSSDSTVPSGIQMECIVQNVEIPVSLEEPQENPSVLSNFAQEVEPLNQEVPEPSMAGSQFTAKETPNTESTDEPLNQQIPAERNSLTPTHERSGSSIKEESAFKVLKPKSAAPVVQNETRNEEPVVIAKVKSPPGFQEVNLETVPDNLERPLDHEESKKELSLSSAFRQQLRPQKKSHLDTSKASLWDALDSNLPCVLLPPSSFPLLVTNNKLRDKTSSLERESQEVAALTSKMTDLQIQAPITPVVSSQSQSNTPQTEAPKPVVIPSSDTSSIPKPVLSSYDSARAEPLPTSNIVDEGPARTNQMPHHAASSMDISSRPPFQSDFAKEQHSKSSNDMRNRPSSYDYEQQPHHRSFDKYSDPQQQMFDNRGYPGFDDRSYSNRNGSRPSSRMSLDEVADGSRHGDRNHAYRKNYASDYDRPHSRMSESGAYRRDDRRDSRGYYDQSYHHGPYARDDEYHQQTRGYRGYEYDRYRASRQPYYNYYNPYYNYSGYNYGFYDELYRNDPRYKQHVDEQYREYYRRLGYETDYERSSVQSGRSSVNELSKDTSQGYTDNDGSSIDLQNSQTYEQQSQFSSFDVSEGQLSTPAHRLTPSKFSAPHTIARFSNNGQLLTIIPRQSGSDLPPLVEFHDMQILTQDLDSFEELRDFQGPLVRGETHKNDVIDFCVQKVKFYKQKDGIPDRDSYVLLWELLILLLRQNGSVAGSDIAELLLKDHEVLQSLPQLRSAAYLPQGDSPPAESVDAHQNHAPAGGDASSPDEGIGDTRVKAIVNTAQSGDSERITRKFREFLLFGHKKDALEWAMKHDLWGHALFLASKMDGRMYANVMTRFANSLALNDPLQTLYQLMSGRQPAAVTCIADKHWGDWRPHLAMILSNPSPHSEVDFKSITTLGDTLASQGCLPATHFCYLMAQVEFGAFSCKSSKLVLLCANHQLPFESFAVNEAIQCTEIYEYAQSLANPGFVLTHLQAYKFIYATRLADHGFLQEALHYCEVLAANFLANPTVYPLDLLSQVYDLASKLKYQDPHYLQGHGEVDQLGDPEWLKAFAALLQHLQGNEQVAMPNYGGIVPEPAFHSDGYTQKPFNEATSQEVPNSEVPTDNYYGLQNQQNFYPNNWISGNILQQQQQQNEVQNYEPPAPQQESYQMGYTPQWNTGASQPPVYKPNVESATEDVHSALEPSPSQRFTYYGSEPQMPAHNTVARERTTSTSSMSLPRDRRDSVLSSGSDYGSGAGGAAPSNRTEHSRSDDKAEKPRPQVGKSWLGGIFSRLLPKAPNQMILPDDKNPTIVWDSQNNRWINNDTNGEDEASSPVAPPKDAELMSKSPAEISGMPPIAASSTPVANKFQRAKVRGMRQNYVDILQTSTSAAKPAVSNEGFFPLMSLPQNSAKVFVPQATFSDEDQPIDFVSTHQNSYDPSQDNSEDGIPKAPPMFDPAEFNSRKSNMNSIRHSVGPAHRTYPT